MAKELNMLNKSLQENLDLTAYSQVGHTHNYAGSSTVGGAANTAVKLHTARTINGTNFDGSGNITTANWGTARTITIGKTGKSVNGSGNVGWTLAEIGAADSGHTHTSMQEEDLTSKTISLNDLNLSAGTTHIKYYYCPTDGGGSNITGRPNDSNKKAFNLEVELIRWASTTDYITKQTYTQGAERVIFVRYCTNGTWTAWEKVYTSVQKPTYSEVGAAAASHGTHVTYATATPSANGTAAVGTSSKVAREDHVHPLQTTISGAAGSAGKWTTARTLTIGNSGKSVDGSANVSWSLSEIGALPTAGGTMTGNIKFSDVTSTTYPAKSAMLTWNGSTDGADIYYQVDASDKGRLVLNTRDDSDCIIAFANKGTIVSTIDNSGNFSGKASKAGNADTATKLATGRSITIGNQAQTFDGSGNISFSVASIGASESGHTHNYAGSSSAGGAANSVKTNLIIKLNNGGTEGINLFTFNGSTAKTVNITPNAIGAAASSHGTHVTYSTATPLVAGTAAVGSANNVARGDHVHPAQTSVTGNAGTATKLATARTITIGNKSNTFDGSANISYTLADIGAATSGHTHNYAGSSSAGGAANSAVKLSSARTINGTSFDGSANITTANWGTTRKINQISVNGSADVKLPLDYYTCNIGNSNTKPYHHILATGQCAGDYTDKSITIVLVNHYNSAGLGIAKATLRTNQASAGSGATGELRWLVRSGFAENQLCFNIRNTAKDTYMDVFYKSTGTYNSLTWYVLTEGARGSHGSQWTKYNTHHDNGTNVYDETGMKAIRTYTATLQSAADHGAVNSAKTAATCSGNAATATKLATARTLTIGNTGKSFDGSGNQSWSLAEIGAAAEGHTHSSVASANVLNQNTRMEYGWSGLNYFNISGTAGNAAKVNDTPTTAWWHIIRCNHANSTGYYTDIAVPFNETSMYYKRITGGAVQNNGWVKMLDALNFNEYAAAKSHGTHVTYSTTTPLVAGTASVGSANNVSRGDHVHPPQTSVSGNAGTATKLATARTIQIGNKSNSFDGSANISYTLADIGAAATSHTHTQINSRGKVTCESGVAGRPAANGLSMSEAYNNDYPTPYGNVISLKGTGDGQILVGWSGTDGAHAPVYVRSKRDNTSTANWSEWAQFYTTANKPTYSDVGAAAASHGTHVTWSTTAPKVAGTAAVGSETKVARGDHVHAAQTSVSGNAGTATKLATARTLTIGSTGKSFDGSANVSWSLSEIGAAASSHTHNYAGSGSAGGAANSATKLATARTITLKGAVTGSGTFDGSANLEITTTRAPYFAGEGTSGTSGYIAFAQLKITGNYTNRPLEFKLICRGKQTPCYVQVQFANTNNTDPDLSSLKYWGTDYGVFAHKTGAGTWLLYHTKSEGYDKVEVVDVNIASQGITITYPGSFITAKPTADFTDASLGGSIGSASTATSATKLATARNIKIGNATKSFNGTANVEFTLAEIGIGSSISAVASNLSGVTINGYDSMMTTINSNLGKL